LTRDGTRKPGKYQDIVASLRTAIERGDYAEGARLPSEFDLVKQTGASRPTVSRALRELQAVGLIRRRVGSGSYVLKATPPTQHKLFGLLIPRFGDTEIFELICGQIAREAEKGHYGLLWGDLTQSVANQLIAERTCEPYIRQRVAGVFFAPLELSAGKDEVNHRIAQTFKDAGIPVVLLDRDLSGFPNRSDFDLVGVDNFAVGYTLAKHLIERGSKRFLFVAHPLSAETVQARVTGAFAALADADRTPDSDWMQLLDASDANAIRAMIERHKPDAIICANDKTAAELMQVLSKLHIRVPSQVRVAGVDDVRYAKLLSPALTTVHQPCQAIGEVAMQTMLERIAHPVGLAKHIMLPISLIERDSSR
jgi:GntR family transcriptional regulator, arabinose operon transcriptional repressor